MKNLLFIIPFGLLLSIACGSSFKKETAQLHKVTSTASQSSSNAELGKQALDEYWPFEETLKKEDPFVSELLAIN